MAQLSRLAILFLGLGATALVAQDAAAEGATQTNHSLLSMVFGSGPVEWILLILSVVGVSLGIQRMLTIKRDVLVPDGLVDDIHNVFADGVNDDSVDDALNMVSGDPSMLGEVLAAALDKKDFGYPSMAEAAETVGAAEHNKYMTQISWLSLLAAIGPMLGLLGTVVGMIGAFLVMASSGGNVNPSMLANDIGGAMITTATGLIIAIPMMFFFFFRFLFFFLRNLHSNLTQY